MQVTHRYSILEDVRQLTETDLIHLASRKYLGIPLANNMRRWLREQPRHHLLLLDFTGIKTMNGSVAQEVGPLLMESIMQSSLYEHHYPFFGVDNADIADSLALSFAQLNLNALGLVTEPIEQTPVITPIDRHPHHTIVVFGPLSQQNTHILHLAVRLSYRQRYLTSDQLGQLPFLAQVSAAARSKRLTELYTRRLLAFQENPNNARERLFFPPWRLPYL